MNLLLLDVASLFLVCKNTTPPLRFSPDDMSFFIPSCDRLSRCEGQFTGIIDSASTMHLLT